MINNNLLKNLNDEQLAAILYNEGPSIIIAGAGVGKTRVLTHKIAYLIAVLQIPSKKILALTFTNKAAKEMKTRVQELLNDQETKVKIATYHSLCAQILRQEISVLNFTKNFNIIDDIDQRQILKNILNQDFDTKAEASELKLLINFISKWKNHHLTKDDVIIDYDEQKEWVLRAKVYEKYQEYLQLNNCLDFDDLLLKVAKIFKEFPEILAKWQNRFQFVLVDEFQDTDDLQYQILLDLTKKYQNLTVVGDPDQTIYTWRGANINLILKFTEKFPQAKTFILNQNYRSTTKILDTANSLITHNQLRIAKNLFTTNKLGEDIYIFHASDANQEANWVANVIKQTLVLKENVKLNQIAVLYRNTYLSRNLEEAFINHNLNYKIIGGLKFFQRKEIKDILAYLKVIAWNDNLSMIRILNTTPKVGPKTIEKLLEQANENNLTLSEYLFSFQHNLIKNQKVNLQPIIDLIAKFKNQISTLVSVEKIVSDLLKDTKYIKKLEDNFETERIENIKQFLEHLAEFDRNNPTLKGEELLTNYLQEVSLYTDFEETKNIDAVSFMTIHSAKGLEFPVVFIIGINEGILPHITTTNDNLTQNEKRKLEEERRVFYVAITRAKQLLVLTSNNGFSYNLKKENYPSQFFQELNPQNLKVIVLNHNLNEKFYPKNYKFNQISNKQGTKALVETNNVKNPWEVNDLLFHNIFGKGIVVKIIGNKIQVAFHKNSGGVKILDANHKGIRKIIKNCF